MSRNHALSSLASSETGTGRVVRLSPPVQNVTLSGATSATVAMS